MNDIKTLNKRYEAVAWGAMFLLLGILSLIPGDQNDVFVLGIGIILLGLNLARYLSKIPTNGFTITLGVLAFVLGGVAVLRPVLNFPRFELPLLPLLLVVIGLYLLIPGPKRVENA
jgi:hypothetical protein